MANAIVYFEEAIRQKNDHLAMYNLANILIYDESVKKNIERSIELLIKSSNRFAISYLLLSSFLIKQFGFDTEKIVKIIEKVDGVSNEKVLIVIKIITTMKEKGHSWCDMLYENYRKVDFLYDVNLNEIPSDMEKFDKSKDTSNLLKLKELSNEFYEGFGYDLLYDL